MMTSRINNQIIESVPLRPKMFAHASVRRIPLVDAHFVKREINVPSIYFNNANTVQFNFDYVLSSRQAGPLPLSIRLTSIQIRASIFQVSSFAYQLCSMR